MHLPARTCPFGPDDFLAHVGTPFEPAPELAEKLVSMMNTARYGLAEIAETAKISIEQLTIWMMRPSIAARLDAMESCFARRCRLQLANNTSAIIHCCEEVIHYYHYAQSHMDIRDPRVANMLQVKQGANALLACRLLLHLAKHFSPGKPASVGRSSGPTADLPARPDPLAVRANQSPAAADPRALPANSPFDLLGQLASVALNFGDREQGAITPDEVSRDEGPAIPDLGNSEVERTLEASSPAPGGRGPTCAEHKSDEGGRAATLTPPSQLHPAPNQPPSSSIGIGPDRRGPSTTTITREPLACDAAADCRTETAPDRISDQPRGGMLAAKPQPTPASTLRSQSGSANSRDRP